MLQFILSVVILVATGGCDSSAKPRIGWRTDGNGRYLAANPPAKWSTSQNVAWKTRMPSWSNSSPVLATPSLMVVCSEPDQVLGIDPQSGGILWTQSLGDVSSVDSTKTHGSTDTPRTHL